jgi:hypothetical protein
VVAITRKFCCDRTIMTDVTGAYVTILAMAPMGGDRDQARRRFVADPDVLAALDLELEQLADPDVRGLVIRREHPQFEEALNAGWREVDVGGSPINPRLHLAMHEVVATQLWDDSPSEVWDTAARLLDAGYERHEILHMLAGPVVGQVWEAWHEKQPYDRAEHIAALNALPGSWERDRASRTAASRHTDGRKQARRAARAARQRNRRPR